MRSKENPIGSHIYFLGAAPFDGERKQCNTKGQDNIGDGDDDDDAVVRMSVESWHLRGVFGVEFPHELSSAMDMPSFR